MAEAEAGEGERCWEEAAEEIAATPAAAAAKGEFDAERAAVWMAPNEPVLRLPSVTVIEGALAEEGVPPAELSAGAAACVACKVVGVISITITRTSTLG